MINTFICPTLLSNHVCDDPKLFEKEHIAPIIKLKNLCELNSKSTKVLKQSIDRFRNNPPWDKMQDSNWKGYLLEWKQFVLPFLEKCMIDIKESATGDNCNSLHVYDNIERNTWTYLLVDIQSHTAVNCIPVIISSTACDKNKCYKHELLNVDNFERELIFVSNPWLRYFDEDLPVSGEYPFVPPKGWDQCGKLIKGEKNGFVDASGNEWVHDTERKDHWDVQLKDGSHVNVSYTGKIIS